MLTLTLVAAACSSGDDAEPESTASPAAPTPATQPASPTATVAPEPTETPSTPTAKANPSTPASGSKYNSVQTMYLVFGGPDSTSEKFAQGLKAASEADDKSLVPVIIDMMRFIGLNELADEAGRTLHDLTGQAFGGGRGAWSNWIEWLGKNVKDYRPPPGYAQWKTILYASTVDQRYFVLMNTDVPYNDRYDLTEVVWGGVRPDGIPDLINPPHIPASEANYLAPDERVFGVSINGEHRAYPVRIVNPHEMANDFLGGEPISLSY